MELEPRECIVCGETYEPKSKNQKYCSQRCADQKHKTINRFEIFQRDGFKCRYCGRTPSDGAKLEVDHIYPKSRGGKDDQINLVTACQRCNVHKSDKMLKEDTIKMLWRENQELERSKRHKDYKAMLKKYRH